MDNQPVCSPSFEEIDFDFRVSGLPHAVAKQAESFRVQELVQRIENHPHREAFHADLQQNDVYNPFSNNSKAMIRELDNVEQLELCETSTKKCNPQNAFFIGIALVDSSWLKAKLEESFIN